MSLHFHDLRVKSVQRDTDESVIVGFEVPDDLGEAFAFQPGQYLTLRAQVAGEDLRRSYSICAGADDGELRVGVRLLPGGAFSRWVHEGLKAGDALQVFPPQGHFHMPFDAAARRHVLGIAAGSGITPILAIMKTLLAREPGSRFTLIYGNRRQASTMFREEIEDLKNRYLTRLALHHVFSREPQDAAISEGRLTRDKLGQFFGAASDGAQIRVPLIDAAGVDEVFVCGPYEMNDEAEAALLAAGVARGRIHIERFGAPPLGAGPAHPVLAGDAPLARVTVIRDGHRREIEFSAADPSLLDAAARAGMDVPFSCKSGVCSTCRARLLEGEVRMDRNFALEPHEVEAGFILTCQAHPLSARVVVSYDDR
ncbi:MAG TPA: phenylacetate-CoA oxygenase/reductase subunit PaaK [Burkholderiaceae bacterium]|nr:phenylacetate-CoA oxygenase/reductase subunit PaaK [Burkholderiaceae bacterium]